MKMTKREAILTALTIAGGSLSHTTDTLSATDPGPTHATGTAPTTNWTLVSPPQTLLFDLSQFKEFRFTLGKDTITFTPAEIMAALK